MHLQQHHTRRRHISLDWKSQTVSGVPYRLKRRLTGTDFWQMAIDKEMLHVCPAFHIYNKGVKPLIGSKWIPCHMIFKIDFTRKARFVTGGHVTDPPTSIDVQVLLHDKAFPLLS